MLVFIGLYWGLMLFDMVAEESIQNGFLVLFVVSFIYTAIIWYTTTNYSIITISITIIIIIRLLRIMLQPSFSTLFHVFLRKIRVTKSSSSNVKLNSNSTNAPTVVKNVTTTRKGSSSLELINMSTSTRRISFSDAVPSPLQSPVAV